MLKGHNIFHYFVNLLITLIKSIIFITAWALIALAGYYIFKSQVSPYNTILGIPLLLIGMGLAANDIWSLILDIISWRFNKETCIFCKNR